jgi:predicted XRE-type DNA-binding protein
MYNRVHHHFVHLPSIRQIRQQANSQQVGIRNSNGLYVIHSDINSFNRDKLTIMCRSQQTSRIASSAQAPE